MPGISTVYQSLPSFSKDSLHYARVFFPLFFPYSLLFYSYYDSYSLLLYSLPKLSHTQEFFKVKAWPLIILSFHYLLWHSPMLKALLITFTQRTLKTFTVLKSQKDFISCHIALSKISSPMLVVGLIWTSLCIPNCSGKTSTALPVSIISIGF